MASNGLLLVEESTAVIVSGGRRETRSAHFLVPRAACDRPLPALPASLRRDAGAVPVAEEELKVDLKVWPVFSPAWARWVDKLREKHEALWLEAGILDAVVTSKYRLWREESVLLQAVAFWSSGNNTFVFPWGEATVTLEDVAVLGGLPLMGQPVYSALSEDLHRDAEALEVVRRAMNKTKSRKANPSRWTKHFLDRPEEEDEGREAAMTLLEHGAFLATWLSIYVLPAPPSYTIHPFMFPLAARLARGVRVALAPAVLASIYNGVSALKHRIDDGDDRQPLAVFAPLHILQVWFWERFPELRPGETSTLADIVNVHRGGVSRALGGATSGDQQRRSPPGIFSPCSYRRRSSTVARQLGFDQDVPASAAGGGTTNSWAFYDPHEPKDITSIIVPSRDPGVTAEYARWWEPYSSACAR